jgi:hypothetical protein
MIIKLEPSPLKNKRLRATMNTGEHYDFGFKNPKTGEHGNTFIDNHSTTQRELYRNRHLGNKTEKMLITNLVPSPSTLSYWILWGPHTSLKKNVEYLNDLWKQKHLAKK